MKSFIVPAIIMSNFFQSYKSQEKHLSIGDPVPKFSLYDQDDHLFNVENHIGKKILVIYFYPKDESAVCTKEACAFRDEYAEFMKYGALVVGISSGSVTSHKNFQQNHQLPFILLSDPGNKILKLFGVKGKFIFSGRETFVVDMNSKIVFTYNSFLEGKKHAADALQFIKSMKN